METELSIIKGIYLGFIFEREFNPRNLRKGQFALRLQEFLQTLVAIIKSKRRINTALALKVEKALRLEEGYFMILQIYYEIEKEKRMQNTEKLDLTKLRPVLFWDTNKLNKT